MSILAPGYANNTTPFYAGTKCGNITQTETYTTSGAQPVTVGFTDPATWSDTQSFTSEDTLTWTCQTTGIYILKFNQTVDVTNNYTPPDSAITVIPTTAFFLDISGTLTAPQTGNAILHSSVGTQSSVTASELAPTSDVLMVTFVTPVGFLTNTVIPGGPWNLSIWASTTDETELNTMYLSVYEVDVDGVSDPVLIFDGTTGTPFIVNTNAVVNYNNTVTLPTFEVASITRRLQFRLYANFGVASSISFYTRNLTTSSLTTTVSQDVVPLTRDTVDARITVTSATTEFNQVFASSIPIAMTQTVGQTLTYSTSVNAIANVYKGDTIECSLTSILGNVIVTSGQTTLPMPSNTLQWNLLAEGPYGNPNVIAEPAPMMMSVPVVVSENEDRGPIITSTTEISQEVINLRASS